MYLKMGCTVKMMKSMIREASLKIIKTFQVVNPLWKLWSCYNQCALSGFQSTLSVVGYYLFKMLYYACKIWLNHCYIKITLKNLYQYIAVNMSFCYHSQAPF